VEKVFINGKPWNAMSLEVSAEVVPFLDTVFLTCVIMGKKTKRRATAGGSGAY
jgi:hypothetical protein